MSKRLIRATAGRRDRATVAVTCDCHPRRYARLLPPSGLLVHPPHCADLKLNGQGFPFAGTHLLPDGTRPG